MLNAAERARQVDLDEQFQKIGGGANLTGMGSGDNRRE